MKVWVLLKNGSVHGIHCTLEEALCGPTFQRTEIYWKVEETVLDDTQTYESVGVIKGEHDSDVRLDTDKWEIAAAWIPNKEDQGEQTQ